MNDFQIADLTMIFLELRSMHNELIVRNAYDTGLISEADYKSYLRDQMNLIAKGGDHGTDKRETMGSSDV